MIQPEINHSASFKEKPAMATSPAIRIVMPIPTTDNKPKLLTQLSQAIRSRHYSRKTEATYIHWIKRFIFFHHVRHPQEMAEPEINAFLTHLAVKENVSASTQNQALCAIIRETPIPKAKRSGIGKLNNPAQRRVLTTKLLGG